MPRKTSWSKRGGRSRPWCFNEAAARCRGKRQAAAGDDAGGSASMRPRPDAAENRRVGRRLVGACRASMRPRPDAAENGRLLISTVDEEALQ